MTENLNTEQRTLEEVLDDGRFHPILSGINIHGYTLSTFYVSELTEMPMEEVDHSDAFCYRVEFTPERFSPGSFSAIGRIATLNHETEYSVIEVMGMMFLQNRTVSQARYAARRKAEFEDDTFKDAPF